MARLRNPIHGKKKPSSPLTAPYQFDSSISLRWASSMFNPLRFYWPDTNLQAESLAHPCWTLICSGKVAKLPCL
ncbi:unnamed protein product [Urochloa humidicola]